MEVNIRSNSFPEKSPQSEIRKEYLKFAHSNAQDSYNKAQNESSNDTAVQIWKAEVLDAVGQRIAAYHDPILIPHWLQKAIQLPPLGTLDGSTQIEIREACAASPSPSPRALGIPELLELIIQNATTATQISCFYVCKTWRKIVSRIVKRATRDFNPAVSVIPIELGDRIHASYSPLKPDPGDLFDFKREVARYYAYDELLLHVDVGSVVYFPAILTQAHVPDPALAQARAIYDYQRSWKGAFKWFVETLRDSGLHVPSYSSYQVSAARCVPSTRFHPRPRWLDLSQFALNPYLLCLFPGRVTLKKGLCEITLRPGTKPRDMLLDPCVPSFTLDLIAESTVTNPPCAALSIKFWKTQTSLDFPRKLCRVGSATAVTGEAVRVRDVLSALERVVELVMRCWLLDAVDMKTKITGEDWETDVWHVPGKPKVVLGLDNLDADEGRSNLTDFTYAQELYTESREKRQGEWMPRMIMSPRT